MVTIPLVTGCAGLPSLEGRTETFAVTDSQATRLGRAVAARAASHPGKTGVYPLPLGSDAFAARMALAGAAERSLDLQYYIWHGDVTGYLLLEQVWRAANLMTACRYSLSSTGITLAPASSRNS